MRQYIIIAMLASLCSPPLFAMFANFQTPQEDGNRACTLDQIANTLRSHDLETVKSIFFSPDSVRALYPLLVINNEKQQQRKSKGVKSMTEQAKEQTQPALLILQALKNLQATGKISLYDLSRAIFPLDEEEMSIATTIALFTDYEKILNTYYTFNSSEIRQASVSSVLKNDPDVYAQAAYDDINRMKNTLKNTYGSNLISSIETFNASVAVNPPSYAAYDEDTQIQPIYFMISNSSINKYLPMSPIQAVIKNLFEYMDWNSYVSLIKALQSSILQDSNILENIATNFERLLRQSGDTCRSTQNVATFKEIVIKQIAAEGVMHFHSSDLLNTASTFTAGIVTEANSQQSKEIASIILIQAINQSLIQQQSFDDKKPYHNILQALFENFTGDTINLYRLTGVVAQNYSKLDIHRNLLDQCKEYLCAKLDSRHAPRVMRHLDNEYGYDTAACDWPRNIRQVIRISLTESINNLLTTNSSINVCYRLANACSQSGNNLLKDNILKIIKPANDQKYN